MAGVELHMSWVDPYTKQDTIQDAKSKLGCWAKLVFIGKKVLPVTLLSAMGFGLYAYKQTQVKHYLFGVGALFMTIPFTIFTMAKNHKRLLEVNKQVEEAGG